MLFRSWESTDDALVLFLHQSELLSDDAQALMLASSTVAENVAIDFPETATQEVISPDDSDESKDAELHSPLSSQSVASSESPVSNSDADGGSDYEPPTYEPISKPSTPVPEDDHPLPRLSYSKEELYIGEPPTF